MDYKNKIIYWSPRILSLGFVLFLSLFSLDALSGGSSWQNILGLLIHLLPSFALLAIVIIAWKYDLFGAAAFFVFAIYYVFAVGFDRHWSWYVSISAPAIIVGILFVLSWLQKRKS
ncbi:MAG: hypothetical protein WC461_00670 [Candidatus Paceibacterota bacterium]